MHTNVTGWIADPTEWVPPRAHPLPRDVEVREERWRRQDSTGNELGYQGGVGGPCTHLSPPFGYWCSQAANRSGGLNKNQSNRATWWTHRSPSGVVHGSSHRDNVGAGGAGAGGAGAGASSTGRPAKTKLLPHTPYANPQGAIVHACRGGKNCWYTWMWEVDAQPNNDTLTWTVGGFQGAEGSDEGGLWYIESVFEELDWPTEFFFDKD